MKRFNKENLKAHLEHHIARLEIEHNFNPDNGYDQVKDSDFMRVMAYGEYDALQKVWDSIEYGLL